VVIDLSSETVPDVTTLLKFRNLLDEHKLGERIFAEVGQVLQTRRSKAQERHHRGCYADRRAFLDEDQGESAGP
jgi:IS5 family transposase